MASDLTADRRGPESRFGQGMAAVRLDDTVAALKRDLTGTQIELLRLRSENTDLRRRLRDATEKIGMFGQVRRKAREAEIIAMVRRQQSASRSRRPI